DARLLLGDRGAHSGDDAARLVSRDHARLARDAARHGPRRVRGRAVVMQIAAAHARRLDLEDDVPGPRCRIWEIPQLELSVPAKYAAFHGVPLWGVGVGAAAAPAAIAEPRRASARPTGHGVT